MDNNKSINGKYLLYKEDYAEAAARWDAFWQGEITDRPVVSITVPDPAEINYAAYPDHYYNRVYGDLDQLTDGVLRNASASLYLGEAIPSAFLSFGCDEIAAFCGGELRFHPDSIETNWSVPFVDDWEKVLPLAVGKDNPLWLRMLKYIAIMAEKAEGKMLINPLDLHTNMDLLLAVRGAEKLCLDLVDRPEVIDKAMASARAVFLDVWHATRKAGNLPVKSGATLQCDFSCMIGTEMFRRWALPALEEEAEIVGHVRYHWDGIGALTHTDDLIASKGLYLLDFVPGEGNGSHADYLELFQKVQAGGKAVAVHGSIEMIKWMHHQLDPRLVAYTTRTDTQAEAESLLAWFCKNT
jgi:hypothetical protein